MTLGDPVSPRNLALFAGGVAFFIATIFVELRQKYPTLDLTLFKIRLFAAANLTSFLMD